MYKLLRCKSLCIQRFFLKSGQFPFPDFVAVIIRKMQIFNPVGHFIGHRVIPTSKCLEILFLAFDFYVINKQSKQCKECKQRCAEKSEHHP